jgi:hypothetical protein
VIGLGGAWAARPVADPPGEAPKLMIEGWAMFGGFGISSLGPEDRQV